MARLSFAAILLCVMLAPQVVRGESASTIPETALIQPAELAKELGSGASPVILQVGFATLYAQSHIPGSLYAGPTRDEEGLENLRKQVKDLPKDKPLVIYCGCCPWTKCPNVAAAWKEVTAEGFTRVKVLYIEENFGANWVDKGYPATPGS